MDKQTLPELFLQKLELLTPEERAILIKSIQWFNKPFFVEDDKNKMDKQLLSQQNKADIKYGNLRNTQ